MKNENSYFDFADDDFLYFKKDYEKGRRANYMVSMAQSICERYLKHLIDTQYEPKNFKQNAIKSNVLHTYSLEKLLKFINENMDCQVSTKINSALYSINEIFSKTDIELGTRWI